MRARLEIVFIGVGALALCLSVAAAGFTRRPPVSRPADFPATNHLLWIGAHPDDEILAAPILGEICLERRVPCTFLVATRGEAGDCLLPGGCGPDLGRVRESEVAASAALFGADLVQWSLADGGGANDGAGWIAQAGSESAIADAIRAAIVSSGADLVFTFDERHGSTFHPDHREIGRLVRLAVEGMGQGTPKLILLETILDVSSAGDDLVLGLHGWPGSTAWDADRPLRSLGVSAWMLLVRQLRVHPTQFDQRWLDAAGRIPASEHRVWWTSAVGFDGRGTMPAR